MNKNLVILAAVFVVLAGLWFATRTSAPSAGVQTLAVAPIAKDAVQKLTITVPGRETPVVNAPADAPAAPPVKAADQKIVIAKDGAGFVVANADAPAKRYAVEQSQFDAVLDAIAEFSPGDRVSNKADKLKDFELDDAQATHIVVETDKGKVLDLLFGRAAKSGGTTVRQAGSNDVFVAKGRLGALVKKDLSQWRKKSVTGKKAEDFTAVTVANKDGSTFTTTSTSEAVPPPADGADPATPPPPPKKTWALTTPSTLPAGFRLDAQALSRLSASLASLRANDFADDVSDEGSGFSAAHTVVTGTLADGGTVVLHLGNGDDKSRVYARVDGDTQVYLVPESSAKSLDKRLDDLRDTTLFGDGAPRTVDDVVAASFVSGKDKVSIKKAADGTWAVLEPKKAPAEFDVAQAGNVVAAALRLKGTRVLHDVADAGGTDPAIALTFGDGTTKAVRFGALKEGETEAKAKGADGLVYAVSAGIRARYAKPVELFKTPPAPPQGMGGMGGMQGLESLPPDVRAKLEASMRQQGMGN